MHKKKISGQCRAGSDCSYMSADLAQRTTPNKSVATNDRIRVNICHSFKKKKNPKTPFSRQIMVDEYIDMYPLPHSSVGGVADLRTVGRWFDPRLSQYSFQGLMIVIATGFIPLAAVHCFDNGYVGKQPVAWKEYCAEYWLQKTPGKHG